MDTSNIKLESDTDTMTEAQESTLSMLLELNEAAGTVDDTNTLNHEQVDNKATEMLDLAMAAVAQYDDVGKVIYAQGPELLFDCLAQLTERQIMSYTKRIIKNISRQVFTAYSQVWRMQNEEVRGQGVDGYELTFSEMISDYQGTEYDMDNVPAPLLMEQAAHQLYQNLHVAYMKAEKVAFGWRDDYTLQGLPWLSYSDNDGDTWHNVITLDEALTRLDKEREQFKEQQRTDDLAAIANIKNIGKKQAA